MLDWIVPIRLSGKWMSVEVERGVKIMLSLILLATIPTHAISKTLEVVPPDAADSMVWTKFSLYLLCDIIVYVDIVAGVLLLKPFVLELIEIIEEFIKKKAETNDEESLIQEIVLMVKVDPIEVPLPIHSKPQPLEQDIWWILNKRKRYMYENKGNIRNKIHFYGVVNESLEMLLNDFSFVVHKYSAPKSHSIKAWRKLYTEMLQDLKNNL